MAAFAWVAVDLVPGTGAPPGAPTITSIVPNPGPAGAVTVNGTNFISGATVSFGGSAATSVVVVNSGQITCNAPAHADGAVNVTVTTTGGTSGNYSFTYQAQTQSGFVTRSGTTLMLDGAPYQFWGTNCYGLTGCHTGRPLSHAADDRYFAQLQPYTMTRIWAFEPQGITGLTRTIASAEAHNQKLIVSLMDGGGYCGEPYRDVAWYTGGYATSSTWTWIITVCNTFRNSPAVAMWEIGNEICDGCTPAQTATFLEAAAQRIRTVDTNHLISSGLQAPYMFDGSAGQYATAQNAPHVDVCSVHEYDYPYNNSRTIISDWYTIAKQAADSINRPLYVGEIGISLATGSMTAQERADALVQKYDGYLGDGAAGAMYWICLGAPNNPGTNTGSLYGNRDPMIGGAVMDAIIGYTPP